MSNPLYQEMNNINTGNPLSMLSQLRNNPVQFAISKGFNIPYNIGTDPNSIIQYLMNSGQISQDRYNQVVRAVQNIGNLPFMNRG